MGRTSIIQEYYTLAVNERGSMPAMRRDESNAGLVAAGIMDLLLSGSIVMERKKITAVKELPGELGHLESLYTYLKEKPRSVDKLMSDYLLSTGSRIRSLTAQTGEALLEEGLAVKDAGGLFGNKAVYIPEKAYKNELINTIKAAVAAEGEMTPGDVALICILKETKNLNQYFSEFEKDALKARLKEMKKAPENKRLAEMVNYVSDMAAVMTALFVTCTMG